MIKKILECPQIYENDQLIGYGGNQEWFNDKWQRLAGCGSVSATNIYSFYIDENRRYSKTIYLQRMEEMFNRFVPGKRGFPYVYIYARNMRKILKAAGLDYDFKIYRNPGLAKGLDFVIKQLDQHNPVALLILGHGHVSLWEDNWHWVTIFGYQREKNDYFLYISDCGKKKKILAKNLFRQGIMNNIKLVSFGNFK